MTFEEEALFANDTFYLAFTQKDYAAMERLWAARYPTLCIHPGWRALGTREEILESWRQILGNPQQPGIDFYNATAASLDSVVMVTCYEELPGSVCIASNGFVREGGELRMFHHHSGPCASPPPATRREDSTRH